MRYLPNKDRGYKKIAYSTAAVILFTGCLYFWCSSITSFIFNVGTIVSYPFWSLQEYTSNKISGFLINFDNKKELIKENEYLTDKIELFRYFELENNLIRRENEELRKMLGRGELKENFSLITKNSKSDENKTLAYVLSGPITPPYDNIILDVGIDLGVNIGDVVVSNNGYVMGEIVEATPEYSKARLFSSYGLKTSVFLGDSKTMIDIVGMGSGNFSVSVPNDFKIKESELAIYPGFGSDIVAKVSRIEGKEGEMLKNIFLSAPFNIRETDLVGVVKKTVK